MIGRIQKRRTAAVLARSTVPGRNLDRPDVSQAVHLSVQTSTAKAKVDRRRLSWGTHTTGCLGVAALAQRAQLLAVQQVSCHWLPTPVRIFRICYCWRPATLLQSFCTRLGGLLSIRTVTTAVRITAFCRLFSGFSQLFARSLATYHFSKSAYLLQCARTVHATKILCWTCFGNEPNTPWASSVTTASPSVTSWF